MSTVSNFDANTEGVALFFKSKSGATYFYFIAYDIHWGYSDGGAVGPGVVGTLYYNRGYFEEGGILDQHEHADHIIEQSRGKRGRDVRVWFYDPISPDTRFAEFIAHDPEDISGNNGTLDTRLKARWSRGQYNQYTAYAKKNCGTPTTTIAAVRYKTATMDISSIEGESFNVDGNLIVKYDNHGKYAIWSKDHCAFYRKSPEEHPADFTAVFLPLNLLEDMGSAHDTLVEGVTWVNT